MKYDLSFLRKYHTYVVAALLAAALFSLYWGILDPNAEYQDRRMKPAESFKIDYLQSDSKWQSIAADANDSLFSICSKINSDGSYQQTLGCVMATIERNREKFPANDDRYHLQLNQKYDFPLKL